MQKEKRGMGDMKSGSLSHKDIEEFDYMIKTKDCMKEIYYIKYE